MRLLQTILLAVISLLGTVHVVEATITRPNLRPLPSLPRIKQVPIQQFEGRSRGWHWVYDGIAHAQSFTATGRQVGSLELRLAWLNGKAPAAPLEIEIRDPSLMKAHVRASIRPEQADRDFRWIAAKLHLATPLQQGQKYVLVLHSKQTEHDAPWVVNAIYRDLYPQGRHLGHADDLLFSVAFRDGMSLRVGPADRSDIDRPINSGAPGGKPLGKRLMLHTLSPRPAIAVRDPFGSLRICEPVQQQPESTVGN